jgi:hypothetical protein
MLVCAFCDKGAVVRLTTDDAFVQNLCKKHLTLHLDVLLSECLEKGHGYIAVILRPLL